MKNIVYGQELLILKALERGLQNLGINNLINFWSNIIRQNLTNFFVDQNLLVLIDEIDQKITKIESKKESIDKEKQKEIEKLKEQRNTSTKGRTSIPYQYRPINKDKYDTKNNAKITKSDSNKNKENKNYTNRIIERKSNSNATRYNRNTGNETKPTIPDKNKREYLNTLNNLENNTFNYQEEKLGQNILEISKKNQKIISFIDIDLFFQRIALEKKIYDDLNDNDTLLNGICIQHPIFMATNTFISKLISCFNYFYTRYLNQDSEKNANQKNGQTSNRRNANDYRNRTRPEMIRWCYTHNRMDVLEVLDNYVRAICAADSISPRKYNVAETIDRGFAEFQKENDPTINPSSDPDVNIQRSKALLEAEARRNRAQIKLDKKRNRVKSYYTEDIIDPQTGEILYKKGSRVKSTDIIPGTNHPIRYSKIHHFEAFCTFLTNAGRLMGVIAFAPIIVGNYAEKFAGNIYAKESNMILGKLFDFTAGNPFNINETNQEAYRPTPLMYAHITSDESAKALNAWKTLMRIGGQDAVMLFYKNYTELNEENVRSFLYSDVNKLSLSKDQNEAKVAKKICLFI